MPEEWMDEPVIDMLESMTDEDRRRYDPPDEVWQGIAAVLDEPGLDVASAGAGRPRRSAALPVWLLVAAVALPVALFAATALRRPASDTVRPEILATAEMVGGALPDALTDVSAAATLDAAGDVVLEVTQGALPEADGFYELWVIKPDLSGMYSLGVAVDGGTYVLPAGVDPAEYSIVDISVEPLDGQPTHSGVSVLRGSLDA